MDLVIIVFIDDFSKKPWIYFLKTKSQAFSKFLEFRSLVEKECDLSIETLRSDRGGEYLSQQFISFLRSEGITHQLTMTRTPQQNGVVERRNKSIIERARSMGIISKCPRFLWTELVNTTNILVNLSPTRANKGITPDEFYYKKIPHVDHLHIFGAICYLHISKETKIQIIEQNQEVFFGRL